LEDFERLANHISDRDRDWWPFLFLRPARDQRIKPLRIVILAVLYGLPFGMLLDIIYALTGSEVTMERPYLIPLVMIGGLFFSYSITLARAWNSRADRLRRQFEWRERCGLPEAQSPETSDDEG
jgi:hypothetical protein